MTDVIVDLDDFGDRFATEWDELRSLAAEFEGFKVSLFTIPTTLSTSMADRVLSEGWAQLCLHGELHVRHECEGWSVEKARAQLAAWPYTKVFKAPYWESSPALHQAVEEDSSWAIAEHPKHRAKLRGRALRVYFTDDEPGVVSVHGHFGVTPRSDIQLFRTTLRSIHRPRFLFIPERF